MTLLLDIRTLLQITLLFSLVFGTALYLYSRRYKDFAGLELIAIGLVSMGVGSSLLGLRDLVSEFVTVIVANMLMVSSVVLAGYGVLRFYQLAVRWEPVVAAFVMLALPVALLWYTYVDPNVGARVIAVSVAFAIFSFAITVRLIAAKPVRFAKQPMQGLAVGFVIASVFHLFRMVWTVNQSELTDFMSANTVNALAILISNLLILLTPFMIILSGSDYLQHELRELVRRDPLTGIFNRRAFEEETIKEMGRCKRNASTMALVICDVDHFKRINDAYGHQFGDEVLRAVCNAFESRIRETDMLARYGGEEFVILLPGSAIERGVEVAETLRERIAALNIQPPNDTKPVVTASFGVASYDPTRDEPWDALFDRADQAMYEAKRLGRNRVVAWTAELSKPDHATSTG